jgi:exocyst complex component 6
MIQTAMKLITKALDEVDNAEVVLKIKGVIALFIQTMDASILTLLTYLDTNFQQGWGYSVTALDTFLLTLFEKYAELLQRRFSEDFHEVCRPMLSFPTAC